MSHTCKPCTERWEKIAFLFCEKANGDDLVCNVKGCPICTKLKKATVEIRNGNYDIEPTFTDYRNFEECLTSSPNGWEDRITYYIDILSRMKQRKIIALMV